MARRLCSTLAAGAGAMLAACGVADEDASRPPGPARIVEDLSIGVSSGASEYMFGRIGYIAQHPDGTVIIGDTQGPVIRRYAADGTYMHDIGGLGQGPGELQRLQGLRINGIGDVVTWDPRAGRVSTFRPDGSWVADFHGDSRTYTSAYESLQVDELGNVYLIGSVRRSEEEGGSLRVVFKYSPTGERIDTIEIPDRTADTTGLAVPTDDGFLFNFTTNHTAVVSTRGYVVVGHNGTYAFEYRDGGEAVVTIDRAWTPVAITEGEQAQWNARQRETEERFRQNDSGFVVAEPPTYDPVPATKPAYMDFYAGTEGTIWVRRYAEAHERDDLPPPDPDDQRPPFVWWQYPTLDVFDDEGRFLGTVVLPHGNQPLFFDTEFIWAVRANDEDEDVAVRYTIEGLGGRR